MSLLKSVFSLNFVINGSKESLLEMLLRCFAVVLVVPFYLFSISFQSLHTYIDVIILTYTSSVSNF